MWVGVGLGASSAWDMHQERKMAWVYDVARRARLGADTGVSTSVRVIGA